MTSKEFLGKYDNDKKFTEEEVREIINEGFDNGNDDFVEEIEGEEHRWYREIKQIIKIEDRYFELNWGRGLTECQENEYFADEIYEVEPKKEIIEVTKYVRKGEDE